MNKSGGRFDFEDGGSYSGGWQEGKAHGYGVCTGPKSQGEYAGAWVRGFEESGVYTWPSGNTYSGEWQEGKRHGVGVEIKGHWVYRGEWSHGYKGRYGIRQSTLSCAKYEGTWTTNLQDGYGIETYIDEGTYQGQWQKGMRHGFGVRQSAPYGIAAQYRDKDHLHSSMPSAIDNHFGATDDGSGPGQQQQQPQQQRRGRTPDPGPAITDRHRGGFVLTDRSSPGPGSAGLSEGDHSRSRSSSIGRSLADRFRLRRGQSTGDLPLALHQQRNNAPSMRNGDTGGHGGALGGHGVDITDPEVKEVYLGEWKADKRSGFGVSERSDGLKYVGEWYNDKKHGYGVTTLRDGTKEEGKYKDNELITSGRKRKLFTMSKTRLRDRVDGAVVAATRAAEVAQQKALIAVTRKASARQKAESSDKAAMKALTDADLARDEAIKYNQQTPQKASPREVPVNPKTRVRLLPGHEDNESGPNRLPEGLTGDLTSAGNRSSRLLPPRQESSDSYNSNQSSSLGSSSVPTSPPPPKPPRSPPMGVDDYTQPPNPDIYPPRNNPPPVGVREPPPIVARMNNPLYASDSKGAPPLTRSSSIGGRPGYDEVQGSRSIDPGRKVQLEKRNSFREFRSDQRIESSSNNSFKDFSDSADSGGGPPNTITAPRNHLGDALTSPRILLRPATPTNLPGPSPPSRDSALFQPNHVPHHHHRPPQEGPISRGPQMTGEGASKPFSPVLSDRRYDEDRMNGTPSRRSSSGGGDGLKGAGAPLPYRQSLTRQSSVEFSRQQPYSSSPVDTRFPEPQLSSRYSSVSQGQLHDYASLRTRSRPDSVLPLQRRAMPQVSMRSNATPGNGNLRRRETLPSIVRYPQTTTKTPSPGGGSISRPQDGHPYHSGPPQKETFIVENGVRRRLIVEPPSVFERWETAAEEREPRVRLQRFTLEPAPGPMGPIGGLSKQGMVKSSLPDVYRAREASNSIPREQVFALSQQRRDELRRQREERERGTLIIRLADVTAWCKDNQLILILVALNLSLAAIFLNFLNHGGSSGGSKT